MQRCLRYSRRQLWLCNTHKHVLISRIAISLIFCASIIAVLHWQWNSNHQADVVLSEFRTFDDLQVEHRSAMPSRIGICFITAHLPGSTQNSGMGVAILTLAEELAKESIFSVSILFADFVEIEAGVRASIAGRGIQLETLSRSQVELFPSGDNRYVSLSWQVYQWLKQFGHRYDILHFHEWNGIGLFTAAAKSQGEFSHQLLVTTIHCPVSFFRHGNQQHVGKLRTLMADWMEKFQTEHSSVVLAPSRFILNWVHTVQNWTLPSETFVQPNIASADAIISSGSQRNSNIPDSILEINEIIYFGRLEVLKGVDDFVDALDWLLSHHAQVVLHERSFPLKITFLGQANIKNIINQIKDHAIARRWPFELSFHSSLSSSESLQYFKQQLQVGLGTSSGPLAVLLSRIDNSPNTVLELTSLGVPFVAMNVGGVSELIDRSDHARVLINSTSFGSLMQSHFSFSQLPKFNDDLSSYSGSDVSRIADKIALALQHGFRPVKSAFIAQNARKRMSTFHQTHLPKLLRQQLSSRKPIEPLNILVSVVTCHHNRGNYLVESIRSIFQQTHSQIELILVDDGSTEPDAIRYLAALASFFTERWGSRFHIIDESNSASNFMSLNEPEIQQEIMEYVVSRLANLPLMNFHRIVLVLNKNQRPGGSRNLGVKYSHGEFVAFLDDDDLVRSNWIAALLNVALQRSADVVTTMADFFHDIDWQPWLPYANRNHRLFQNTSSIPIFARWLPIGSAAAAGMFENMYGAYASLWNRQAFKRIGGFSEDFASTFEDWELFSTAVLSGLKLELCVEPVYLYRRYSDHHRSQNQTRASAAHLMGSGQTHAYLNELRALRPYLNAVPRELRDVLSFSIGLYHHHTGSQ